MINFNNGLGVGISPLSKVPWQTLICLGLAYVLVGWYLAAHHVVWFVGIFIAALVFALSLASTPWLNGLFGYIPQALSIILIISTLVTLVVTCSMLSTLVLIPFITTFLAWQELRFLELRKPQAFWILMAVAFLGLGVGEFVDILVLPSGRY